MLEFIVQLYYICPSYEKNKGSSSYYIFMSRSQLAAPLRAYDINFHPRQYFSANSLTKVLTLFF